MQLSAGQYDALEKISRTSNYLSSESPALDYLAENGWVNKYKDHVEEHIAGCRTIRGSTVLDKSHTVIYYYSITEKGKAVLQEYKYSQVTRETLQRQIEELHRIANTAEEEARSAGKEANRAYVLAILSLIVSIILGILGLIFR